jgi:hypothetical protein
MRYRTIWQAGRWIAPVIALAGLATLAASRAAARGSGTIVVLAQNQAPAACCPLSKTDTAGDRPVLDPKKFTGQVREAYQAAKDNPALFTQLHCYCGCDRTAGHKNLLDCYRDMHGATCGICTGEALEAKRMFEQGATVEAIRAALRAHFRNS